MSQTTLGLKPWMTAPATTAVFDALEARGGAGCVRFVGGAVRNALMGRAVDDIDLATTLEPTAVIEALQAAGLKAIPTGLEHGTVTALAQGRTFEITTLRRDVETDGRRAVVAYTTDWAEDAQRRDFTLNALYADRQGNIFDPLGGGVADARAGRIVFVGDARTRIAEDYLRILRFFRFSAWYGTGAPDAEGLAACAEMRDHLTDRPGERVSKELLKLLAADDPRAAVRLMQETGVLAVILPPVEDLSQFDSLVEIESEMLFECDVLLRLACLLPTDQIGVGKAAERLRLSNAERDRLIAARGQGPRITSWMSPRESRRAVYALGASTFHDRIKLAWAASPRTATAPQWRGLIALAGSWQAPPFPLTGEDVVHAGVPRGPMVGDVLREVEAWWIDHDFLDDKFSAIEKLKAVAQGMAY
ncbi:MAG: CCA tRNA nucleotidyltransferase [Caulobacteraceae bacterium]|nr:CCA tRNA nucleotidyltransferase [Caulobacteraceae bacterium]